jgi:osmoprotectant transport system permease protein
VIAAGLAAYNFTFTHKKLSNWQWLHDNLHYIWNLSLDTLFLAVLPVVIALVLAVVLGVASLRSSRVYGALLVLTTFLYSLPSLAAFAVLLIVIGPDDPAVIIPLAVYAFALLLRSVVDGLRDVSDEVRISADAMGYGRLRRILTVELPVAVPVIAAGLRVTTVSSVSLTSVASLIGVPQLGNLLTAGENAGFNFEVIVGIVVIAAWAFLLDALILFGNRSLTPWAKPSR